MRSGRNVKEKQIIYITEFDGNLPSFCMLLLECHEYGSQMHFISPFSLNLIELPISIVFLCYF